MKWNAWLVASEPDSIRERLASSLSCCMTVPPQLLIRFAQEDDRTSLDALEVSRVLDETGAGALVLEREGTIIGAGCVSMSGPATEPDTPTIEAAFSSDAEGGERFVLIESLVDQALARGIVRLLAVCDPMAAEDIRLYESLGFRPTGRGSYHVVAGGIVQYVTGYQDASGSCLDMVIEPA